VSFLSRLTPEQGFTGSIHIKVVDDYVEAENRIPTVFINYRDKLDPDEDA